MLNIVTPPLKNRKIFYLCGNSFFITTQKSNQNETLNLFHYFSPMHIYNFGKTFLVDCNLSPTVSDDLLAQHNKDGGTYALYKGKYYRIGVTGFRSLKEFASNQTTCGATAGDTLYVAPGVYTEGATINVAGLTILGNNANRDWTATRDALETELQAVLYIEASNITVNGFKVTKAGRIISETGTNLTPIKNLRVIYNKFENSTVKRDWGYQVVYFGPRATGSAANNTSSQLRYLDCEVAHNHFYYPAGTTTTFPSGVDISGAGGTTHVHDNYFTSGGDKCDNRKCSRGYKRQK